MGHLCIQETPVARSSGLSVTLCDKYPSKSRKGLQELLKHTLTFWTIIMWARIGRAPAARRGYPPD